MKINVFEHINKNSQLEIALRDLYLFEDAEKLVDEIRNNLKDCTIEYLDGIWFDSWSICIDEFKFELIRHDDDGIYFVANKSMDNEKLRDLIYKIFI